MNGNEQSGELHTVADDLEPLTKLEAESMGRQTETLTRGERVEDQVVYGDVGGTVENEDQSSAHHAESDEHV
ncbi:MAG TPA: hypothetical protein VIK27_10275 [Candidatus Aquilonibacter sp.]